MKRRLVIVAGMATPLLFIVICGSIVLIGVAGWWLFRPADQGRLIQIAPLAPLATFVAGPSPESVGDEVVSPAAIEADPNQAVANGQSEPALATPLADAEVASILGFQLPAGAVNSITRQGVATRLVIPKLNLDVPVVISPIKDQTWQVDHLGQKVGHLEGTAAPGSSSNVVLAGHITLAQGVYGPFAGLAQLSPGDIVTVYQGEQKFDYVVDGYDIVERTAIDVTYPTSTGQLTLITCNNWNSQAGRYEQRLVVQSHLAQN